MRVYAQACGKKRDVIPSQCKKAGKPGKIRAMRYILLAIVFLGGCATPYQPMGYRGGYKSRQFSEDAYFVEVRVNSYTSRSTAWSYLHRRAAELCAAAGYRDFRLENPDSSTEYVARTEEDGSTTYDPKSQASSLVRCVSH